VGFILYSATFLPTTGFPYYDVAWSLQHEVFFYLIAAVLVPKFGLKGLTIFLAASAGLAYLLDVPHYNVPISRFHGDFLAGVLAFMVRRRQLHLDSRLVLCVFLVFLCIGLAKPEDFIFSIAWFFALLSCSSLDSVKHRMLRPLVKLGDASYSIYMIHPLIFLYGYAYLIGLPNWAAEPIRFVLIILCCLLSLITFALIERPFIRLGDAIAKRRLGNKRVVPAG